MEQIKAFLPEKTCTFIGKVVFTLVPWMMRDYMGARKLMGENLKLVRAELSTLS
jgi:hypothetical protein